MPWRGQILVLRELAAASPPVQLEPGAQLLWDQRFAVELPASATSRFTLGYLGQRDKTEQSVQSVMAGLDPAISVRAVTDPLVQPGDDDWSSFAGRRTDALPRLLYPVLPAFRDEQGLAAVPHLEYRRPGVGALPDLRFRPANPLTRASFTVV